MFCLQIDYGFKLKKVDQDAIPPPRFKLGDLVWAYYRPKGGDTTVWLSVICPDFGSNDGYTKVEELKCFTPSKYTRHYHVQRIDLNFEQAWILEYQLNLIKRDDVKDMMSTTHARILDDPATFKYCQMFVKKTNEEMVEICRMRYETYYYFLNSSHRKLNIVTEIEFRELKTKNLALKFQLESMQESFDKFVASQNQDKLQNEQKFLSENEQLKNDFKSLKESFEELKNSVMSQNQVQPKNEQETESNNENAKEIELEKVKDHVEEVPELNQIIKDLKKDNSKLAKEIERKDSVIENLKEELLKLSKENADLKYGK